MNISNLKIGARLGLGFAAVLILLCLVSFIGIYSMSEMNGRTSTLVTHDFIKVKLAASALDNLRGSIARVFEVVALNDDEKSKEARGHLKANIDRVNEDLTALEPLLQRPKSREIFTKSKETYQLYAASVEKTMGLSSSGKNDDATTMAFGETYKQLHACAENLRDLMAYQQQVFEESGEMSSQNYVSSRNQVILLTLLAIAFGVVGSVWITRSITRPVDHAVLIAETIASGDLTGDFTSQHNDETGNLIRALQSMKESLVRIVSEVSSGSHTIMQATSEISQGNMDLSARTEAQAGALEETASSMEELTSTVKQNADNARQADKMAQQATDVAIKGGEAVSQVVSTMEAINDSSKKIVDIISVIDGIAFQTNILALNAAVEAARAGEQGRGFAVVASEVRNLAQRSAAAAKEIKTLIGDSVEKVETGSRQVDVAGATMDEVVRSIKQVTDIMGEITSASQEQSQGIDQINTVIIEMDNTTQKNTALVEEAAAASKALSDQANNLMSVISAFKINSTVRPQASRADPARSQPARPAVKPAAPRVETRRPAPAMIKNEAKGNASEEGWEEF